MPDEFFSRPPPVLNQAAPRRNGGASPRVLLGLALLGFVCGVVLVIYLTWNGQISLGKHGSTAPDGAARQVVTTPAANPAILLGGLDSRIAGLEQRLTRIDAQAAAADGNTARAEALLVAFAVRRTVERGAPLGYLADQLKLRFGDAQPGAVQLLTEAGRTPVTLDQLTQQLETLGPELAQAPVSQSGWDRFRDEIGSLFEIHHEDAPAMRPETRLDRAKLLLRTGQVDAAANEVASLPGSAAAARWIASARRYAATERALDLIETTALLAPARTKPASATPATTTPQAPQSPAPAPAPAPAGATRN